MGVVKLHPCCVCRDVFGEFTICEFVISCVCSDNNTCDIKHVSSATYINSEVEHLSSAVVCHVVAAICMSSQQLCLLLLCVCVVSPIS